MANKLRFTADEIEMRINDYFNYCKDRDKPLTMSALALFLECSRTTLYKYEHEIVMMREYSENDRQRIVNAIKKAKQTVEAWQEEQLFNGKNPAGTIFALKNNFSWKDVQEVNNSTVISQKSALNELTTQEIKALLGNTLEEE